jgi:hypothetical protein
MVPHLDFTMSGTVAASFLVALSLPLLHLLVVRIGCLRGRNAVQFLVSVMVGVAVWTSILLFVALARPNSGTEIAIGAMILGAGILFFLEIWALLSRGYTLSLLIAVYQAGRPLSAKELAHAYRRGEGLEWILRHRLAGLQSAGLVRQVGDHIILTPQFGRAVALTCRAAVAFLGLKATG